METNEANDVNPTIQHKIVLKPPLTNVEMAELTNGVAIMSAK